MKNDRGTFGYDPYLQYGLSKHIMYYQPIRHVHAVKHALLLSKVQTMSFVQ